MRVVAASHNDLVRTSVPRLCDVWISNEIELVRAFVRCHESQSERPGATSIGHQSSVKDVKSRILWPEAELSLTKLPEKKGRARS